VLCGSSLVNALRLCFEVQTGKHLLGLNLTAFDPERKSRWLFDIQRRQ
jgi:hypothetical protein